MKYLFVLLFLAAFIFPAQKMGYTDTSPIWSHFTYMFRHAGIIHFAVNSLAFMGMFRMLEKYMKNWILALSICAIGFITSFFSAGNIPTVGCSSCVYAMIGIFLALVVLDVIVFRKPANLLIFIISIMVCLIVSFFKSNSNFWLHLFSLQIGFIVGIIYETVNLIQIPNS
jgi:membrane associated rhomboid family serine protease